MVWSTFFYQCIPGDVRACRDGLEHFFSTFVHLTERGGEDLSNLGNAHIQPTHFKRRLPLGLSVSRMIYVDEDSTSLRLVGFTY